jgi:hypothetical protein
MSEKMLELDLRLLLLRYGRSNVIRALARLEDGTVDGVEQELRRLEAVPKRKRSRPSAQEMIAIESRSQPELAEPLRILVTSYSNGVFLPQLRDVRRFLDRVGRPPGKIKSRADAIPKLIHALANLKLEELASLVNGGAISGESDFSLLARAIMGEPPSPEENGPLL